MASGAETQRLNLTSLPPEILQNVLSFVQPHDLARVSRTCQGLNNFVQDNGQLCREIYLRLFDDPSEAAVSVEVDWQQELQDFVRLTRVCSEEWPDKTSELPFVHDTVVRLLKRSSHPVRASVRRTVSAVTFFPSRNTSLLAQIFEDASVRRSFLCQSYIWQRARGNGKFLERPPKAEHQMSAKLHCLYGVPQLDSVMISNHSTPEQSPACRATEMPENHSISEYAIAKVYDLREFTPQTAWGPFLADGSGRTDWERLEAIMIVLKYGIVRMGLEDEHPLFDSCWNRPFDGAWRNSYVPMPLIPPKDGDLEKDDPFGVSGTYMRVICFLDYGGFFDFNFHNGIIEQTGELVTNDMPRPIVSIGEAARLMMMKLVVTKVEELEDKGPEATVVHFTGRTELLHGFGSQNLGSGIRGTVRFTPDGEVRWTTVSVFAGQDRWSSEGIQVGGPRSAKCVFGNWFDVNHDPTGPVGPSAFWKISDKDPEDSDDNFSASDVFPYFYPNHHGAGPAGSDSEESGTDA